MNPKGDLASFYVLSRGAQHRLYFLICMRIKKTMPLYLEALEFNREEQLRVRRQADEL